MPPDGLAGDVRREFETETPARTIRCALVRAQFNHLANGRSIRAQPRTITHAAEVVLGKWAVKFPVGESVELGLG